MGRFKEIEMDGGQLAATADEQTEDGLWHCSVDGVTKHKDHGCSVNTLRPARYY
eukprot:m.24466 g.24466  ORF g.24466 m.24466 type:complete len:54 (-) comp11511_c0_seq1:203-364(-)